MGRRAYRRLAVGSEVYVWRVDHRHEAAEPGELSGRDWKCVERIGFTRDGHPGRLLVAFREPGFIVGGWPYSHAGAVTETEGDGYLNLNEPGTARAVLDAALAAGHGFRGGGVEADGGALFAEVLRRRSAAGTGPAADRVNPHTDEHSAHKHSAHKHSADENSADDTASSP